SNRITGWHRLCRFFWQLVQCRQSKSGAMGGYQDTGSQWMVCVYVESPRLKRPNSAEYRIHHQIIHSGVFIWPEKRRSDEYYRCKWILRCNTVNRAQLCVADAKIRHCRCLEIARDSATPSRQ